MNRFGFFLSSSFVLALAFPLRAQDPPRAAAPEATPGPGRRPSLRNLPGLRQQRPRTTAQAATPPAPAAPAAPSPADRDPPGAGGPLPSNMDKIAAATDVPFKPAPAGQRVKFNLEDADLAELVKHISGLTGRRFIYGAKVRQIKATVISPEPVSVEEAYQAFLSILEANGMTVVPHGRFLKIVDSGGVVAQPTPVYARGEPVPAADRYVTRLYRLENVNPDEVVAILNKFKSKEADISVHTPGKLLIITDTATQVQRLLRIVEEIDVGGAGQHMWIEPVKNGSAGDMAKRLNELFELGAAPNAPSSGRAAGLSRVLADDSSNSLIVVGTEDSYLRLLELLKRLDSRRPDGGGRVHVLPLQHAIADEMSGTLTQMLGSGGQKGGAGAGNAGGMFEGEVRVTPDKSTNSLVITSSNRDYATLRLVVDELDRPRRQVFIEAAIMDLGVSDVTTLGLAYHGGTQLGGAGDPLFLAGFRAETSLAFPVPGSDPTLLQGLAAGLRGAPIGGESNLLGTGLSIPAFGVVLQALTNSGKSNVLATPHVIATDNVPAEINIGDNIPLQTNVGGSALSSLAGAAGANAGALGGLGLLGGLGFGTSPRQDVGNKIKITPHVNESNQVRLEIELESSSAGAPVGQLGAVPIAKRTTNTTAVVQDQQTVVIGGLMKDEYIMARQKIPVLGDLPLLGALFRRNETTKRKANLLLILTPHVIREQSDLRRIFERKMQERQEFLDRYFVFATADWEAPRDWSRTNGLVEDIRQAYAEVEEHIQLELESRGYEEEERVPSPPIELPSDVRGGDSGGGAPAGGGKAAPQQPQQPRRRRQAPAPAQRRNQGSNRSPFLDNPLARSVGLLRTD